MPTDPAAALAVAIGAARIRAGQADTRARHLAAAADAAEAAEDAAHVVYRAAVTNANIAAVRAGRADIRARHLAAAADAAEAAEEAAYAVYRDAGTDAEFARAAADAARAAADRVIAIYTGGVSAKSSTEAAEGRTQQGISIITTLDEYLEGQQPKGFNPVPHYFAGGDYISYFFADDRCYAKRVDDFLTVYYSDATGELVGYKITGIRQLLTDADADAAKQPLTLWPTTCAVCGTNYDAGNRRSGGERDCPYCGAEFIPDHPHYKAGGF